MITACRERSSAFIRTRQRQRPLKTDGGTIVSITTGSDGTGTSRLIPPGTYYVKEYQAPKGHSLNETIMEVVVTAGTQYSNPDWGYNCQQADDQLPEPEEELFESDVNE